MASVARIGQRTCLCRVHLLEPESHVSSGEKSLRYPIVSCFLLDSPLYQRSIFRINWPSAARVCLRIRSLPPPSDPLALILAVPCYMHDSKYGPGTHGLLLAAVHRHGCFGGCPPRGPSLDEAVKCGCERGRIPANVHKGPRDGRGTPTVSELVLARLVSNNSHLVSKFVSSLPTGFRARVQVSRPMRWLSVAGTFVIGAESNAPAQAKSAQQSLCLFNDARFFSVFSIAFLTLRLLINAADLKKHEKK